MSVGLLFLAIMVMGLIGAPEVYAQVDTGPTPAAASETDDGISFLSLLFKGGWFMLPLVGLSVLIVIIAVERFLVMRTENTLPPELVESLGKLSAQSEGFDPRAAYRICQSSPSVAAKVVQTMLLKVGRPISEIENAVSESAQREADRIHTPMRWLELSAAVAPLIGLLGTVWGVTQAFYETTQLTAGQNKAEALASGIYTALITTICGLLIAIPALVLYQLLEAKISRLFREIDEMMLNLIPQVERFEGQVRFGDPTASPNGSETPRKKTSSNSDKRKNKPSDSGPLTESVSS